MKDVNEKGFYGAIAIRLSHPSKEFNELVKAINLPTSYQWKADDVLYRGEKLPPRLRGENHWCSKIELYKSSFSDRLDSALNQLWNEKDGIVAFTEGGGRFEIYLQLDGRENVGGVISNVNLRKISALGAELAIEVFPNNS